MFDRCFLKTFKKRKIDVTDVIDILEIIFSLGDIASS